MSCSAVPSAAPVCRAGTTARFNPLHYAVGDPNAIASGKSWYRNVCSMCHRGRTDGRGKRGNGADLRKLELGFRRYVETLKHGRQVEGRTQGMPASNGVIDDKTIYEIAAHLETLAIEGANWKANWMEGVVRK